MLEAVSVTHEQGEGQVIPRESVQLEKVWSQGWILVKRKQVPVIDYGKANNQDDKKVVLILISPETSEIGL